MNDGRICVSQIQHMSVNDGEGIRTTVFLSGCTLRCKWCSNPETWSPLPVEGRLPDGSTEVFGRFMTASEVVEEIRPSMIFFRASGGGVTWSGGGPFLFPDNLRILVTACAELGISQAAETSCNFEWDQCEDILAMLDFLFVDIKHMDSARHRALTGVDNGRILENIRRVGRLGVETVARVPLISGVNDDDENIRRTAAFVREALPSRKMELLPYHDFGRVKYVMLGMENLWHSFSTPSPERIAALEALIAAEGVEVVHYR